jgi:hypothetical protein
MLFLLKTKTTTHNLYLVCTTHKETPIRLRRPLPILLQLPKLLLCLAALFLLPAPLQEEAEEEGQWIR